MAHHWDSGFMVRKPSWHRLERAVLAESPRNWEDARQAAGLLWEIEKAPVFTAYEGMLEECEHFLPSDQCEQCPTTYVPGYEPIEGYQQIRRDDTHAVLSIRPTSYEAIANADFGGVIDSVLGIEDDEHVEFEALMSLYGGKQVVALCFFSKPLEMPWDNSETYTYCSFSSRHDGFGGLRGLPTNVRVQCANTLNNAELISGYKAGFTIRHTSNWESRVAEMRAHMVTARGEGQKWVEFSEQLARWSATPRRRDTYLKQLFPVSDDNGTRKNDNQMENRTKVRMILESESCSEIKDTGYGLLMATTEWSDHYRGTQSGETYVGRQLLRIEEPKARASRILRKMADITI